KGEELVGVDRVYGRLRVWVPGKPSPLTATLEIGPHSRDPALAFSPDGRFLAGVGGHNELRVWDSKGWAEVLRTRDVTALDFAPDGRRLAVGRSTGAVRLLEPRSWEARETLYTDVPSHEDILYLKFTADGGHLVLVTGSRDPE